MVVSIKDTVRLIGVSIVTCCAVFVCTLFLNYNIDLAMIENDISTEAGIAMYHAQVSMGKVTVAVTGGCLVITSAIMLLFYIKNYIDKHGKELGILKALGYSNFQIAKHFRVFGVNVLEGCALGFVMASLYLPSFYDTQNAERLFPEFPVRFHPMLAFLLIGVPTIAFTVISIIYADLKLKNPVMDLLKEKTDNKVKVGKSEAGAQPFLKDLSKTTLKSKKAYVFFVGFSAFCFSAMVQMSMSMNELASDTFAYMILSIGLILAFVTLMMSLSSVVKGNTKTFAMMRAFGYSHSKCSHAVLGAYRPVSYVGFAIGTVYQYVLLKAVITLVFSEIENMPEYHFDFRALAITLVAFIVIYELMMYCFSLRVKKLSVKQIFSE